MNRESATALIQRYKDFPHTELFGAHPYNYPLFHLLECYSKGWRIDRIYLTEQGNGWAWNIERTLIDIEFEKIAYHCKRGENQIWRYVARNANIVNGVIGYVQEDLYARYVGKCTPLKTSNTTWGFTPLETIAPNRKFEGKIGRNTPLYCLEIDLDTTDVIGYRDPKVPWHYLQQTINWKPYTDRIDWNNNPQQQ